MGNMKEFKKATHSLKGTSANLGALALASYYSEIEMLAGNADINEIKTLLIKTEIEQKNVCRAMKAERTRIA